MGYINQDANIYNRKGQLLHKVGQYPKEPQPVSGNMNVMYVGIEKHRKNAKKKK